jgi:hypothetical protein
MKPRRAQCQVNLRGFRERDAKSCTEWIISFCLETTEKWGIKEQGNENGMEKWSWKSAGK